MKKIELHAKTKYSFDQESTIDIKSILLKTKINEERGIIFVDKDSIISFQKIEKIYNDLCLKDESFKKLKIGYGVQLTAIIDDKEYEVVVLVKKQEGLTELYQLMSSYLSNLNKKILLEKLLNQKNLLLGLLLNEDSMNLDLSLFDYLEINGNIDTTYIKDKNKIVYSNIPNALSEKELKAKEVLYFHQHIDKNPECRLYLDADDTLQEFNNKEIVITNSNMIFDNLDNIVINDGKFYTTHVDNFKEFENLVINSFKRKYNDPSDKLWGRLNEELRLIKELDYTYFYILVMIITDYCKDNHEYYQLDGYINNSLIAYTLNITEIEPFNLPYELFFSEIPKLEIKVAPNFYHKKIFPFLRDKFKNNLIRCNSHFKLTNKSILRVIKHYEIKTKKQFKASLKDNITAILNDTPLHRKDHLNTIFYVLPEDKTISDFTPSEVITLDDDNKINGLHFDYRDLSNNLIRLQFLLYDDIENVSNLINKTNFKVEDYNDNKVLNLFRNTEEVNCNFRMLNKITGTLNIRYFDSEEIENKLTNISNICFDDLTRLLMNLNHGIIKDELYSELKQSNMGDNDIFYVINYLGNNNSHLMSKASLLNKVRIAYIEMYYKLYYSKDYYEEMLSNIEYKYINDAFFQYDTEAIKKRYFELSDRNELYLPMMEYEEYKLLKLLIEMYERNIKFYFADKKIKIQQI